MTLNGLECRGKSVYSHVHRPCTCTYSIILHTSQKVFAHDDHLHFELSIVAVCIMRSVFGIVRISALPYQECIIEERRLSHSA